ncbi:DUF1990 domain-containing protein [Streptomyces armeniacus]|uniref:DUF1990 domain-containing protein n=1 Tax=Streptomyces armeniacus TaxID=83291 RepID=A0A345Y0C9_9ACTN|nr:DUF1990 domain-containing protein [Streptomyces armeniacus]AXK37345.1 DUF1990 domain-containing protein [Streptomyces armeniacus]
MGGTEHGRAPAGYRTLTRHTRLGRGDAVFRAAAGAVAEWRMHRAMGVGIETDAPRAVPGAEVTVALGAGRLRLRAPCRVVWTAAEARRAGWGYGTLPGHPVRGEEAFLVSRDAADTVWLTVTAFSRPATWWTRALGPVLPVLQRAYARRCGAVLRRVVREEGGGRTEWPKT